MKIRHTVPADLPALLEIYAYARQQMKLNGNPHQWRDNRPSAEVICRDIDLGQSYVVTEGDDLLAVFAFIIGDDPTYAVIEDGAWLSDAPYGVIHRLAASGRQSGMLNFIFDWCEAQIPDIRVDTHRDNAIMHHLLLKRGYKACGTIYVDDGSPRIAYQRVSRR